MSSDVAMTPVKSSSIAAVGYDDKAQLAVIQFTNGKTYRYQHVPPHEFEALKNASSIGKHFNTHFSKRFAHH